MPRCTATGGRGRPPTTRWSPDARRHPQAVPEPRRTPRAPRAPRAAAALRRRLPPRRARTQADKLMAIQKDLEQTKAVMHDTIESALERGAAPAARRRRRRRALPSSARRRVARRADREVGGSLRLLKDVLHHGQEAQPVLRANVTRNSIQCRSCAAGRPTLSRGGVGPLRWSSRGNHRR